MSAAIVSAPGAHGSILVDGGMGTVEAQLQDLAYSGIEVATLQGCLDGLSLDVGDRTAVTIDPVLQLDGLVSRGHQTVGQRGQLGVQGWLYLFAQTDRGLDQLAVEMQAAIIDDGIELPQFLLGVRQQPNAM